MQELYENFCQYLKHEKRFSANTVQSYQHDLYQFIVFMHSTGTNDVAVVDTAYIEKYLNYLRGQKLSDATIARNLSCLRTFFKYLLSIKKITFDPMVGVKGIKTAHKLPEIMTTDEVERILNQPSLISTRGKRDKAMLEVLYATGMKVSELISLTIHDVNLDVGYIITGQGTSKERFIPLYAVAAKSIKNYLEFARPAFLKDHTPTDALFLNYIGQPMSRQGFWKIIKAYAKSANIEKDITPITLRHSFATHLMKNGADMDTIKNILGHSTLASTKVYAKVLKDRYMTVYENCHPRAKLR